jgi:hypothetical protein
MKPSEKAQRLIAIVEKEVYEGWGIGDALPTYIARLERVAEAARNTHCGNPVLEDALYARDELLDALADLDNHDADKEQP